MNLGTTSALAGLGQGIEQGINTGLRIADFQQRRRAQDYDIQRQQAIDTRQGLLNQREDEEYAYQSERRRKNEALKSIAAGSYRFINANPGEEFDLNMFPQEVKQIYPGMSKAKRSVKSTDGKTIDLYGDGDTVLSRVPIKVFEDAKESSERLLAFEGIAQPGSPYREIHVPDGKGGMFRAIIVGNSTVATTDEDGRLKSTGRGVGAGVRMQLKNIPVRNAKGKVVGTRTVMFDPSTGEMQDDAGAYVQEYNQYLSEKEYTPGRNGIFTGNWKGNDKDAESEADRRWQKTGMPNEMAPHRNNQAVADPRKLGINMNQDFVQDQNYVMSYDSVEEADAAGLPPGTKIMIQGRMAVVE